MTISADPSRQLPKLLTVAGHGDTINARIFGRYLSKHQGRIMNGHTLQHVATRKHAQVWRVCLSDGELGEFGGVISNPSHGNVSENEKRCIKLTLAEKELKKTHQNPPNSPNSHFPAESANQPGHNAPDDGYMDSLAESLQPVTADDLGEVPRPTAPLSHQARQLYRYLLDTSSTGWKTSRELARNVGMDANKVQSAATELST